MIRARTLLVPLLGLLSGPVTGADDATEWSYEGPRGPETWGELAAAYETCKAGLMQSPIDLAAANATAAIPVSVDYADGPLTVRNSGMTVQVDFPAGSYLTSSGRVFELIQVHFHTPSEHTFDGETYPLVAHFVHASDQGSLAVLGVLFEEAPRTASCRRSSTRPVTPAPAPGPWKA